ncbi:SEC10/PgrA surface exclusion domain-containing protein [Streptococcus canis]|uniref:SEC10/PgrA surface exclusion domain-containing protein n=1 Tax=Streptococcus canis TaxID=1329 RepID=UPI00294A2234|nr:SEC10/PgrA surface exclusion domain-containing protein [Streptococcus canis]MDV5972712.1 SEC10/PgrA surface exclusion domain-containing protein [Streptococcus canis]
MRTKTYLVSSAALVAALVATSAKAHADTVIPVNTTGDVAAANENATLETQVKDQETVVANLTEKVEEAKVADDLASQAVDQAKANEATNGDIEAQKAEVASQIVTAEKDVEVANEVVATETKEVEDAQAANQQAQDALKAVESEAGHVETVKQASKVTLDADFIKTLGEKEQPDYSEALTIFGNDNQFEFISEPSDNVIVDINNLTDAQLTDLSHYTAAMVNQVRNQVRNAGINLHVENAVVTKGAVKFAKDVAQNYRNDNWDAYTSSHDKNAINLAASANGLQTMPNGNAYEDAGMARLNKYLTKQFTLADLKQQIYGTVQGMISNDDKSDWKHTESLVGTQFNGGYMGVALSRVGDVVTVHILQVPKSRIQDANKFDTTKINNPYEGEVSSVSTEVFKRLEAARTKAAGTEQTLATQQSELQAAKAHAAELTNKVVQLKEQQAQLGKTVDVSTLVSSAVERKTQTARNLADMQAALDSATAKLNNLKAALVMAPVKPQVSTETPAKPEAHVETPSKPVQPVVPIKPEEPTPSIPNVPVPEAPKSSTEKAELPRHQENPSQFNQSVTPSSTVQSITAKLINSNQPPMAYQAKLPETKDSADKGAIIGFLTLGLALIPFVGKRFKSSQN